MPSPTHSARATLRLAATGAAVLLAVTAIQAQPTPTESKDLQQADAELRRRVGPLIPSIGAALEGNNKDAQRAALGIIADVPVGMSLDARLPSALAAFLTRDDIDPELAAVGLRAFGRIPPSTADPIKGDPTKGDPGRVAELKRVVERHAKSNLVEVRRATVESLASCIQNGTPESKALAKARYFIDLCAVALPVLNDRLGDSDEAVQRGALDGIQATARILSDIYQFDAPPLGDEPKPKEGTSRFDQLRPVLRGLAASIPELARPLAARKPATRLAAARTLEVLAQTRRTILNAGIGDPTPPGDPFPEAWSPLRSALEPRLADPDPQVRLAVTQAMESLGDAFEARAYLRRATTDRIVFVRWAAARALGRSAPAKPETDAVAADVAALARLTNDPDPDVRTAALTALARFGPAAQSATDLVLTAAGRGDVEPRVAAVKALGALQTDADRTVPVLIAGLEHSDLRLRRVAAAGLTRYGPDAKAALPELRKAVASDDPELRLAAAEAILAIERVPKLKEL